MEYVLIIEFIWLAIRINNRYLCFIWSCYSPCKLHGLVIFYRFILVSFLQRHLHYAPIHSNAQACLISQPIWCCTCPLASSNHIAWAQTAFECPKPDQRHFSVFLSSCIWVPKPAQTVSYDWFERLVSDTNMHVLSDWFVALVTDTNAYMLSVVASCTCRMPKFVYDVVLSNFTPFKYLPL